VINMMNSPVILEKLKAQAKGYWSERILSQLEYALKLSFVSEKKDEIEALVSAALDKLHTSFARDGALTKDAALDAESMISPLSDEAKKYTILLASHAHIDMNWMWSYPETVAVTLDTFRTILDMMREYPDFTYAQSQASVYRIVEQYAPEMLSEIKERIREGRWEVTASQWVEGDKNMAGAESLARHLLYTKRYLSKLLDIDPDYLNIDYEPDTFGHNANLPEILSRGGVKYYYHCRALDKNDLIYRWRSPSGAEILVNREAYWYNGIVTADYAFAVPEICKKYGITKTLRVYGVGDHGGGPTRRDIERIKEYGKWPVFPQFKFGTYHEYFEQLESIRETLPIIEKELNSIFTGCYTTQTRIKLANKIGESRLTDADSYSTMSSLLTETMNGNMEVSRSVNEKTNTNENENANENTNKNENANEYANTNALINGNANANTNTNTNINVKTYLKRKMFEAWENVLFNQFHDILPGSGVIDTREYAMGIFQKSLAISNTVSQRAMREIASRIDTSNLPPEEGFKGIGAVISEGAGVGYAIENYGLPQAERGRGKNRIIHFFNPSALDFEGVTEIVLWDWPGENSRLRVCDSSGNRVQHNFMTGYKDSYWGHKLLKLLVYVKVPAFGYSTYTVSENEPTNRSAYPVPSDQVERPYSFILDNGLIKVSLDTVSLAINSIIDNASGAELVNPQQYAGFAVVQEQNRGMSAWRIGRYANLEFLHKNVNVIAWDTNPKSLRQYVTFEIEYGSHTRLEVTYALSKNSKKLDVNVKCDWLEVGGDMIPQLQYRLPLAYRADKGKYSIPMGMVERAATGMDVPVCGMAVALRSSAAEFEAAECQDVAVNAVKQNITTDTACHENDDAAGRSNAVSCQDNAAVAARKANAAAIGLLAQAKYGFRLDDNVLSMTLIHSSNNPDRFPELGEHKINFSVIVVDDISSSALLALQNAFDHPVTFISGTVHEGVLPLDGSAMDIKAESVEVSSVKPAEDDSNAIVVRLYEVNGSQQNVTVNFRCAPKKAEFVDMLEKASANANAGDGSNNYNTVGISIDGNSISFVIGAYAMCNVKVEF
jgi:alpha-mannosidase